MVHDLVHYKLKADLKVSRPQSDKANEEVPASFNKKLCELIKVMIKYFGDSKPVRIWCQDESRFGLGASHFGNQYKYSDNCLAKLMA